VVPLENVAVHPCSTRSLQHKLSHFLLMSFANALGQHSVIRTNNFSSHTHLAPACIALRIPSSNPQPARVNVPCAGLKPEVLFPLILSQVLVNWVYRTPMGVPDVCF